MIPNIAALLGKALSDYEAAAYLLSLGSREDVQEDQEGSRFANFPDAGVSLIHEDERIVTVFLFTAGHQGQVAFAGEAPLGIRLSMTQKDVRSVLGVPQFQMKAKELTFLGRKGPVDRYDTPALSMAFDYDEHTGRILMLTLMLPECVPKATEP